MLWIALALAAALVWGVMNLLDRHVVSVRVRRPLLCACVNCSVALGAVLAVSLLLAPPAAHSGAAAAALLAGAAYVALFVALYAALMREEVSRVIPIMRSTPAVLVLVFAALFLGEALAPRMYVGIALLVAAAALISLRRAAGRVRGSEALGVALLCVLAAAVRATLFKYATIHASLWSALSWQAAGGLLVVLAVVVLRRPRATPEDRRGLKFVVASGGLAVVGWTSFCAAISLGPVSVVVALMSIQVIFVFLAATVIGAIRSKAMEEEIRAHVIALKVIAIAMAVVGTLLVV